jgi:polyvinyl alcohol dehydrogenase (cytochrome)
MNACKTALTGLIAIFIWVSAPDGALAMENAGAVAAVPAQSTHGRELYEQRCAGCHDNPQGRIPARTVIEQTRTPESIIETLTNGVMRPMSNGLNADEIKSIAILLTGREPGNDPQPDLHANMCKKEGAPINLNGPIWNGWGRDMENSRFQPDPGLTASDIPRLKLKWSFAYPSTAYGQPVIVAGRVFIQTRTGQVLSLDAQSGCTYWVYDTGSPVRTAVTIEPIDGTAHERFAAYFGDEKGRVYAVDAMNGQLIWTALADEHPLARISGAPKVYKGVVYVPVSSMEEAAGMTPKYACCTFQGSVVALNASNGDVIWHSYMMDKKPAPTRTNPAGTQMYGPAGVAIWSSPTIDTKRGLLYVGTGDSYTDVQVDTSDSIVALDLATGNRKWVRQVVADDDWLVGCPNAKMPNCPTVTGPDFDFASSPILHTLPNGKQILLAGAKSGVMFGFDPDKAGKVLWHKKIGQGSSVGAIMWGPAVADDNVYVSIGDVVATPPYAPGGVFALKAATGKQVWHARPEPPICHWGKVNCSPAQPGAITVIPGALFAGSWDGYLRAYSTANGKIIWAFDTGQTFDAVNGVKATGGAIDKGSQTIAGGMLFVNSGVTMLQRPGNALLAFTVDGR